MFIGDNPFTVENGELVLTLKPALPGWLFGGEDKASFNFLGKCIVTYHNPGRKDTWSFNLEKTRMILHMVEGKIEIRGNIVRGDLALKVRSGQVKAIDAYLPSSS